MQLFVFILSIPFIGSIIHDVYLNFFVEDEKLQELLKLKVKPEDFKFTDLGWVIERYIPSFLDFLRSLFSQETWEAWVLPVLKEPTILVTGIPFGCVFISLLVVIGFQKMQEIAKGGLSKKKNYEIYDYSKKESIKYKRK